ncbi:MAG: hypothetical protein MUD08_17895 [Cytophagales bacterium]|nr:hypothetical protein [Cytophagales bacterium]
MTLNEFEQSLSAPTPPAGLTPLLQALWHDAKDDWHAAHEIAQAQNTAHHCRLHAYLHRKEGDAWNARYWYDRAKQPVPSVSLQEEWKAMAQEWLDLGQS